MSAVWSSTGNGQLMAEPDAGVVYLPAVVFPMWIEVSIRDGRSEVFHVLFAVDVPAEQARVITAYRPAPEAWEADQKTRRRP